MNQGFGPLIEITGGFGTLILFWFGAYLIQDGQLTVGLLVAFANYVGNFWDPINRLGQMYNQLLVAMASSERIFEFMDEEPSIANKPGAKPIPSIKGDIVFDNVVLNTRKADRRLKESALRPQQVSPLHWLVTPAREKYNYQPDQPLL